MELDTNIRTKVSQQVIATLKAAVPGSYVELRGSLAKNLADQYSDIDLLWEIPDAVFLEYIEKLPQILVTIFPLLSFRSDLDLQNSLKHRLFFVLFDGLPLFWRLDLEVFATSIQRDSQYDLANPEAKGTNWSWTESALMNIIAAIKAHLRHQDSLAENLIHRAYQKVGLETPNDNIYNQLEIFTLLKDYLNPNLTQIILQIHTLIEDLL